MRFPEQYINNNGLQRKNAEDISNTYIQRMVWKSNEIVLDLGCGPGDVTSDILYPLLMNNINQLIGVDKSVEMVEYAKKTYERSKMSFEVLDIENTNDCSFYSHKFNKIFSFFCFHWVRNKADSLSNMNLMLKSGGEILINFMLTNPFAELYTSVDPEWLKYVKLDYKPCLFMCLIDTIKAADDMYTLLPQHLHDRYSLYIKEKICEIQAVEICPITGVTTLSYNPITVHAIKD